MSRLLPAAMKEAGPAFENVTIVETHGYYDGPTFGVCRIEGELFFFTMTVEDIWRTYADGSHARLWRIYTVLDIEVDDFQRALALDEPFEELRSLIDRSESIGIFWDYETEQADPQ